MKKAEYTKLEKAYKKAVKKNQESFKFEGEMMNTTYVKYVLELSVPKFAKTKQSF